MTMMQTSSQTLDLRLLEVKPGLKFPVSTLKAMLPDAETVFFFGKVYELNHVQLSTLLYTVIGGDLATALSDGAHSTDLQGYLGEMVDDIYGVEEGDVVFDPDVPTGEILPEVWKQLEVEVAQSIKDVAAKLTDVIGMLPGKTGEMHFKSMMALNARRPTIGDYRARIHHGRQQQNLLVLDVSGSMSEHTVATIVEDVVALAYNANAHLAIVSNTVTHWEPGNYDVDSVLRKAEYGGTHYEQLAPLMDQDWGVVITVADYDSYVDARDAIRQRTGSIDLVLDVSLVNKPTFLAECLGTIAKEVRPILVAPGPYVLSS
jgi:hypothetical protein